MSNLKVQYSVIEEDGEFFIYDPEQDATVNRWGDVVDEGLFTMAEALATLDFLDGKSPHNSGLKTFIFEVDNTEYQAENYVNGIFINPVLPDNFWTEPMESRTPEHMRHWENMPFITTDEYQAADEFSPFREEFKQNWFNAFPTGTAYRVHCLDGGAWDRPTNFGEFGTLDQAVDFIVEKYRK